MSATVVPGTGQLGCVERDLLEARHDFRLVHAPGPPVHNPIGAECARCGLRVAFEPARKEDPEWAR